MGCPCGEIHHFPDGPAATYQAHLLLLFGPVIRITTPQGRWLVPRIYIAAHSLVAAELPALAARYGWAPAP